MKLTLSFIPDTIVYLKRLSYYGDGNTHVSAQTLWGDQELWGVCNQYFTEKIQHVEKDCMLFIQKGTLKWHVIEFEVDKDVDNILKE